MVSQWITNASRRAAQVRPVQWALGVVFIGWGRIDSAISFIGKLFDISDSMEFLQHKHIVDTMDAFVSSWGWLIGIVVILSALAWPRNRKSMLEIVWKPGEPVFMMAYPSDGSTATHFRVCVRNVTTDVHLKNVRVRLESINPRELECVPCYLRLMNNIIHPERSDSIPVESFDLNPGDHQFVDVLAQDPKHSNFWVWHTIKEFPVTIPVQPYELKLVASASEGMPVEKTLGLVKTGSVWSMKAIDS